VVAVAGTVLFAGNGALGQLNDIVIVHLRGKAKREAMAWLLDPVDVPGLIGGFPPDALLTQHTEGAMRHRHVA
jgi:hypothetical protein